MWSIGQRSKGSRQDDVDRALIEGTIVRTHVLRPTWHFVARDDIRWLLALSGPRVQQGNAGRYRQLGLDARTLARAAKVIASALEGGNRLTRDELAAVLEQRKVDREGQRMPYFLMHCELEAVICSGGRKGKQQTYALFDEQVPVGGPRFDREDAVVELVRRYLTSHGPATVKDLSWWSGLTMTDIRAALGSLEDDVGSDEIDGLTFWSAASERRRRASRGPRCAPPTDLRRARGRVHGVAVPRRHVRRTRATGLERPDLPDRRVPPARAGRRALAADDRGEARSRGDAHVQEGLGRRCRGSRVGGRSARALRRSPRGARDLAVPSALATGIVRGCART